MPVLLHRSGIRVQSVFGLHGTDEDDLSAAFAFGISRSTHLLHAVLQDVAPEYADLCERASVHIQTARSSAGITDVEIRFGDEAIVVFEAKKGPEYPTQAQLAKYVAGCQACGFGKVKMVALTSREPVPGGTPPDWDKIGAPVSARPWRWARGLLREAIRLEKPLATRSLLSELLTFLEEFMGLERTYSNRVYLVVLAGGSPNAWKTSWIDIVEKHHRYFYPVNHGGWPPPPNYMGFRYGGQLQSIRHVESYEVVPDVRPHFPGADRGETWEGPYYLLHLGPEIKPPRSVPNGPNVRRNMRLWCMLDLLLTAPTITDAFAETKKRIKAAEEGAA
jgi:hypothetical protein